MSAAELEHGAHELVRELLGLGADADDDEMEDALWDRFGIVFEDFHKVSVALLPYATIGTSPLTQTTYRGFAKDGVFLLKQEAI